MIIMTGHAVFDEHVREHGDDAERTHFCQVILHGWAPSAAYRLHREDETGRVFRITTSKSLRRHVRAGRARGRRRNSRGTHRAAS